MKILKAILAGTYVFLILLLLLMNLRGCSSNNVRNAGTPTEQNGSINNPGEQAPPVSQPVEDAERSVRQAEQTGSSGALKITLLWDFEADIDLHVIQPNGNEIYFKKASDPSTGGSLDVDNRIGNSGAAENIYWNNPPQGTYSVYVRYYGPSSSTKVAGQGPCTVVIMQEGKEAEVYRVQMTQVEQTAKIVDVVI